MSDLKKRSGADLRAQAAPRVQPSMSSRQQRLDAYREVIVRRQRDFVETGTALGLIAKDNLFKEAGFASFETMVIGEFDMSTSTAYRLVDAARVVTILSQVGTIETKIRNQTQALALAPLGKDREAMVLVITAAEARGRVTADLLADVRVELYPHTRVIEGEVVGERPELVEAVRAEIESVEANQKKTAAAASPTADGGATLTEPPAAGPGPTDPSGEADRPGPVVTPANLIEDAAVFTGDVHVPPSPVQGGAGDGGQAEREEPNSSPPAEPASTEELTSPLSGEADPEQDGTGVTRPAPDPTDPAALLEWFAERWEQVDADVSGPLLTDDDVLLLEASLNRVVFTFELLIKWRDRSQP